MTKKAPNSRKSRLPSESTEPATPSGGGSNRKSAVTVKSNEELRRSTRPRTQSMKKPKTSQKKKPSKIDAKMPKKPPTAFFYFLEDFRKEYKEQNPDVKSMREIGKACGEKWKTMTYEEKVKYYDIATEKRAQFDRAMAEYIKKKELGEYQQSEDDSEYTE